MSRWIAVCCWPPALWSVACPLRWATSPARRPQCQTPWARFAFTNGGYSAAPMEPVVSPCPLGPDRAGQHELSYVVVIPTIGRPSLQNCLDALAAAAGPAPQQVVLADDRRDTPDPLQVTVPAPLADRTIIVTLEGRGPAAARNAGWRAAIPSEWVVFLDDDVCVGPDWSWQLAADLCGAAPDVAGVQAIIRVPPPAQSKPTDAERATLGLADAAWITADMAYRRAALTDAGGFDERFVRAFREDSDLALRATALGWKLRRGCRMTTHPLRPGSSWSSLAAQAGNADDAAMSRLHGRHWRTQACATIGRRPSHLVACGLCAATLILLGTRHRSQAALTASGWLARTADPQGNHGHGRYERRNSPARGRLLGSRFMATPACQILAAPPRCRPLRPGRNACPRRPVQRRSTARGPRAGCRRSSSCAAARGPQNRGRDQPIRHCPGLDHARAGRRCQPPDRSARGALRRLAGVSSRRGGSLPRPQARAGNDPPGRRPPRCGTGGLRGGRRHRRRRVGGAGCRCPGCARAHDRHAPGRAQRGGLCCQPHGGGQRDPGRHSAALMALSARCPAVARWSPRYCGHRGSLTVGAAGTAASRSQGLELAADHGESNRLPSTGNDWL